VSGIYGIEISYGNSFDRKNLDPNGASHCPPIAIFSNKYYNDINMLNHDKIYDYCFIGSIKSNIQARQWVIDFAKKNFTSKSIFVNTDKDPNWISLGDFDYSKSKENLYFCPKDMADNQSKKTQYRIVAENIDYFENMCKSKFILCPAGDTSWSFRFYEALMCKSIPIVENWHHTYRTKEESNIKYKYVLYNDIDKDIDYCDYVNNNTIIFESHHLLK
jgi:hypothetical protein